jgi:hemerythrin-like metal-binding protein
MFLHKLSKVNRVPLQSVSSNARVDESRLIKPAGEYSFQHEHERLNAMLANLNDALERRSHVVELRPAIREMEEYAELHFQHEETAMRETEYPLVHLHCIQHAALRRLITQLETLVDYGFGESVRYGIGVIQHWIQDHLETEDKDFAEFLAPEGSDDST